MKTRFDQDLGLILPRFKSPRDYAARLAKTRGEGVVVITQASSTLLGIFRRTLFDGFRVDTVGLELRFL